MRTCIKCKCKMTLNFFYSDKEYYGNIIRTNSCKKCHGKMVRSWKKKNNEKVVEYRKKSAKKYKSEYAKKIAARRKVSFEIEKGNIKRLPCKICGKRKTEAHHEDYSKPLDVVFLCVKHHAARHNEIRNSKELL